MQLASDELAIVGLKRLQSVLEGQNSKRRRVCVRFADSETPFLDHKGSGFWDAKVTIPTEPTVRKEPTTTFKTRRNGSNYVIQQAIKNYSAAKPKIAAKPVVNTSKSAEPVNFIASKPEGANPGETQQQNSVSKSFSFGKPKEASGPSPTLGSSFGLPVGESSESKSKAPLFGQTDGQSESKPASSPLFGAPSNQDKEASAKKPNQKQGSAEKEPALGSSFGLTLPSKDKPSFAFGANKIGDTADQNSAPALFGAGPKATSGASTGALTASGTAEPTNTKPTFNFGSAQPSTSTFNFGASGGTSEASKPLGASSQSLATEKPAFGGANTATFSAKPQINFTSAPSNGSAPIFGANSTGGPTFGANSASAAPFGANLASSAPAFGASSVPSFGANSQAPANNFAPSGAAASNPLMSGASGPANGRRIAPLRRPRR